jgi:Flp pilus assembly protein TadG
MRCLGAFRDRSGASAIEFALLAPVIAVFIAVGTQFWAMNGAVTNMRSAVDAGARYYLAGGSSDAIAQSLALNAWRNPPSGGAITATRACSCAGGAADCNTLCAATAGPPEELVTLSATARWSAWITPMNLHEERVVRVR